MGLARIGTVVVALAVAVAACSPDRGPTVSPASPTVEPSGQGPALTPVPTALIVATSSSPDGLPTLEPVAGTDLPLAGRDRAPGPVGCGSVGPTTYEALTAGPVGAERLAGPEYDVLRQTIAQYGNDQEFASLKVATFREFRLDDDRVEFLGDVGRPEGAFATVSVAFDGAEWRWAGMDGGCAVTGEPGAGWGTVNWTLDSAFDPPNADTRDLHLLATEAACTLATPLQGRLAPAYVFLEPDRVRIQMFARTADIGALCDGMQPTSVTITLPEPLAGRELEDANPEPCRGCGG